MRHPPRLAHLATRGVLAAKLSPSYAVAHSVDEEEAKARVGQALVGPLLEQLLDATWAAMQERSKRLDEAALLEKVATHLKDRPERPGRQAKSGPAWSAFLLLLDLHAGTAGEAVRRVLESPAGQERIREGLVEGGRFLAAELVRPG